MIVEGIGMLAWYMTYSVVQAVEAGVSVIQ